FSTTLIAKQHIDRYESIPKALLYYFIFALNVFKTLFCALIFSCFPAVAAIQTNQNNVQCAIRDTAHTLGSMYLKSSADSVNQLIRSTNSTDSIAVSRQQAKWISDQIHTKLSDSTLNFQKKNFLRA